MGAAYTAHFVRLVSTRIALSWGDGLLTGNDARGQKRG